MALDGTQSYLTGSRWTARPGPNGCGKARLVSNAPSGRIRSAGTSTDQVRTCDQSQERQGTQPQRPQHANWARGPVDRMRWCMSAFGPKRTCLVALHMSAFGGKADMTFRGSPLLRSEQSGHAVLHCICLLDPKRTSTSVSNATLAIAFVFNGTS